MQNKSLHCSQRMVSLKVKSARKRNYALSASADYLHANFPNLLNFRSTGFFVRNIRDFAVPLTRELSKSFEFPLNAFRSKKHPPFHGTRSNNTPIILRGAPPLTGRWKTAARVQSRSGINYWSCLVRWVRRGPRRKSRNISKWEAYKRRASSKQSGTQRGIKRFSRVSMSLEEVFARLRRDFAAPRARLIIPGRVSRPHQSGVEIGIRQGWSGCIVA